MNLPQLAVTYRPITVTLVMLLMLWGVSAFRTMPRREDPEYTVRTCAVITSWPGAPAEKVEELITDKLEEAIDSIEEVDVVRSTTTSGLSEIYVDAEDSVSAERIDNVWDKVRARVARVALPDPHITPVVNDEFGDVSILLLAVYQLPLPGDDGVLDSNRYTNRELEQIAEDVQDAVRLLPGVSKVELHGVIDEAIYVETDNRTWSQLGLQIAQLQQLLEQRNIVAPGGVIEADAGRFFIKPGGEFNAVEELNRVMIGTGRLSGEKRPVTLADAGLVVRRDYVDPPRRLCRAGDGTQMMPAVIVAVQMKSGSNIIDVCTAAKQRVLQLQQTDRSLPGDIAVEMISDQSENVDGKISQVVGNVIGAIVIVVVIVYLMVGFRTAAVMAANIPVVVLAAVALVTLFDVQLEQISLASIIIALGLLVDNAVQVCDQSRTNQILGIAPEPATITGANQLSMAMLSGTATTIAAFFPMLVALNGSKREYIYSLPVTLTVTLGISWVLAMTFCVVLAALFIRAPSDPLKPSAPVPWLLSLPGRLRGKTPSIGEKSAVERIFRRLVHGALQLKFIVVVGAFCLLLAVLKLPVASEFFPKDLR
ncbi:MAG: efflux RND transporter permease subunit, partial [Planctomycetaceae bacterium]|nr:efflux RND transporter permease subunit [Planctomycetaceae bacterium]